MGSVIQRHFVPKAFESSSPNLGLGINFMLLYRQFSFLLDQTELYYTSDSDSAEVKDCEGILGCVGVFWCGLGVGASIMMFLRERNRFVCYDISKWI